MPLPESIERVQNIESKNSNYALLFGSSDFSVGNILKRNFRYMRLSSKTLEDSHAGQGTLCSSFGPHGAVEGY